MICGFADWWNGDVERQILKYYYWKIDYLKNDLLKIKLLLSFLIESFSILEFKSDEQIYWNDPQIW